MNYVISSDAPDGWVYDELGNPVGVADQQGRIHKFQSDNAVTAQADPITGGISLQIGNTYIPVALSSPNSVMLIGDSMAERGFFAAYASTDAVDNGNGTATMQFSASPIGANVQIAVGDTIRVNNSATPRLNQLSATVTSVSTSAPYSITYTTTGPFSPMVGGGTPFAVSSRSGSVLGFWPFLSMLAGGDIDLAYNISQGGGALSDVSAIFSQLVPATAYCKFGLFICGRNDIYARGRTYAQVVADAKSLIDSAMGVCKHFVAVTTPPQDSTQLGATWSAAKMQAQLQYETWLKDYVRSKGGIVVDAAVATSNGATYRDPASANANPTASWSPDGTHQSGVSAYAIAKAVYAAISPLITVTSKFPTCAAQTYANDPTILTDGMDLSGTGGTVTPGTGTITGTAPTGTTVSVASGSASVTLSQIARTVVADGDAYGNWLRMVVTNAAGASQVTLKIPFTAARFSPSAVVRALARIRVSSSGAPGTGGPVGLVGINLYGQIIFNPPAGAETFRFEAISGAAGTAQALNEGLSGVINTPWTQLRDAAHGPISSGFVMLTIDVSGAAGATIDIAAPHIRQRAI